jgi:hypothetical protein
VASACLAETECRWAWSEAVWDATDAIEAADLVSYAADLAEQISLAAAEDPRRPYLPEEVSAAQRDVQTFLADRRTGLGWMSGLQDP